MISATTELASSCPSSWSLQVSQSSCIDNSSLRLVSKLTSIGPASLQPASKLASLQPAFHSLSVQPAPQIVRLGFVNLLPIPELVSLLFDPAPSMSSGSHLPPACFQVIQPWCTEDLIALIVSLIDATIVAQPELALASKVHPSISIPLIC